MDFIQRTGIVVCAYGLGVLVAYMKDRAQNRGRIRDMRQLLKRWKHDSSETDV